MQDNSEWNSLYGVKKKNLNAQDMWWAVFGIVTEVFRILVSSLLVVFVPQACEMGTCTIKENFEELTPFNKAALGFNFITLGSLLGMYGIIYKRERFLIYHMDEASYQPKTGCEEVFKKYPEIQYGVRRYNTLLLSSTIASGILYLVNMILSAILIFGYFYDGYQSAIQYIVNSALCISILYRSFTHSRSSLVLSNTTFVPTAYNKVDPDYESKVSNPEIVLN